MSVLPDHLPEQECNLKWFQIMVSYLFCCLQGRGFHERHNRLLRKQKGMGTIVSGYTMEQFREDEQSVKDAILEDLQEMFGSDFIVGVSFSSVNTQ